MTNDRNNKNGRFFRKSPSGGRKPISVWTRMGNGLLYLSCPCSRKTIKGKIKQKQKIGRKGKEMKIIRVYGK
jgi:hypothetical protein